MNLNILYSDAKELVSCCEDYKNKKKFIKLTDEEFLEKMKSKFNLLYTKFNSVFLQCLENKMDLEILSYMIKQAKEVNSKKVSNHNASIKVGQILVDRLVKPNLKNKK